MEKRENFKFNMRTINNIAELVEMGLARNKTEAIDIALEHIVTEERTKMMMKSKSAPTGSYTDIEGLFGAEQINQFAVA